MEKFLKTTKIKLIFMILATILPIMFIVYFNILASTLPITDAVKLIRYIIFLFFEITILYKIFVYFKILFDQSKAESEIVKRTDERISFIKNKTFTFEYKLILYVHTLAVVIAGFINDYVFYTLLISIGFILVSAQIVKIYYHKKY